MKALLLGAAAGMIVLWATDFRLRWPWRVGDLEPVRPAGPRSGSSAEPRALYPDRRVTRRRSAGRSTRRIRLTQRDGRHERLGRHARSGDRARSGRLGRQTDGRILRSLPFTADLLLVAFSAGHTIHGAVRAVGELDQGPLGNAFGDVVQRFDSGSSLSDELHELPRQLGDSVRPLVSTLTMGLISGAPLEPALHRLADRQRRRVRRDTEERVRRLPVMLLGPLIALVLPSFVLLTIVPVLVVTARGAGM